MGNGERTIGIEDSSAEQGLESVSQYLAFLVPFKVRRKYHLPKEGEISVTSMNSPDFLNVTLRYCGSVVMICDYNQCR